MAQQWGWKLRLGILAAAAGLGALVGAIAAGRLRLFPR
jgi:hypothetical protein